ncbi:MAG: HAD hydrolase-like protein, partial [Thiogranum sp.]
MNRRIQTVLFDLDGTLLDTAADLANALNAVLRLNKQSPLPFEQIRPVVSHGGRALIELGFKLGPDHPEFDPLKKQLLDYYQSHIADQTTLFPGMSEVLDS